MDGNTREDEDRTGSVSARGVQIHAYTREKCGRVQPARAQKKSRRPERYKIVLPAA